MEIRNRRIIIGKAGGTAGKNSLNYKVSLPAPWMADMEVSENDRNVQLEFDGEKITIRKIEEA